MTEQTILEGFISVAAALEAQSRPLHRILLARDRREPKLGYLERRARSEGIEVARVENDEIAQHATGNSHGGVIALAGARRFVALETLVNPTAASFLVMLDGIEDPFNFGQAVRSLYAAGADGLVLRPRNWMSAAGTVARASAGASERIPTAIAESAEEAAAFFRARGLRVACTAKADATPLYEADLTAPLFLVIGGEKRGITRSFLQQADLLLNIPYERQSALSLDVSSATTILAFEIMRQRRVARNK